MKRILFTLVMLFAIMAYGQKDYSVAFSQEKNDVYQIKFDVNQWDIHTVTYDGVSYSGIIFSQSTVVDKKGWAELPFISASIQLPPQKDVDLNIIYSDYQEIKLDHPLLPSRGIITRSQNPQEIPYKIDPQSIVDRFYPENLAYNEEPFIIRDVRGTSVRIFPFQWNAAQQILRIYSTVTVELVENNNPATNPLLKANGKPIREAIGMYESLFLNFDKTRYDLTMAEYGDILVITTERDSDAINPYITWKKEKGYNVEKTIVATGYTAAETKTLIQGKYDANSSLMYVLLIGDWADIKSESESFNSLGLGTGGKDPMLGCVVGTDNYPDIAIGRFSSNNATHVTTQVNKTIQYEKEPNMEEGWYSSYIGISSNDYSSSADDGERDYVHQERIYTQRLQPNLGYNNYIEIRESTSATTLLNHINTGTSNIGYTGHGSENSFVTTGFNNNNVNQLTNGTRLPFIVSVACINGAFHNSSDCFAEAWLRKENGGALVTWMATILQPWAPPMRGQDYFYDILSGGFDYTQYSGQNGISTTEQRTHWGSIAVNALCLMLAESNTSSDIATIKTWTTFGDPSVQLRTELPNSIVSSNNEILSGIPYETIIASGGNPVENALVCISQDDVYIKGFTDDEGKITLEHNFDEGQVLLVVSGFNTTTIYETIPCIPSQGVHLKFEGYAVNDDNGQLDYSDESVAIGITINNLGGEDANDATIAITSDDPYINIIKNTVTMTIPANNTSTEDNAFEIAVAGNVPDQHEIVFNVNINDNDAWKSSFTILANAPSLTISKILLNELEDGNFMPGEVSEILLSVVNEGHADLFNAQGILSTESNFITIPPDPISFGNLAIGESVDVLFLVAVSETITEGHKGEFDVLYTGKFDFSANDEFELTYSGYCIPGNTNCTTNKLTSFVLSNINNTNTECGENGYSDYTQMSTTLIPENTYTVKVTCSYQNDHVKGWIDFNGDKIFDENEAMFSILCNTADTEYEATFSLPQTAVPGEHRMRIRVKYNAEPDGPCDAWANGQTHDYTVLIEEGFPTVDNFTANLVINSINLSWKTPDLQGKNIVLTGYEVTRNNVKLTESPIGTDETSYLDVDVPNGVYVYKIIAVYETGMSPAKASELVIMREAPRNFNAQGNTDNTTILLTWEVTRTEPAGYNLYRDGQLINTELITENSYADEGLVLEQTYCYTVTAVYPYGESAHSQRKCAIAGSDVGFCEENTDAAFVIYPNPANEIIYLSGEIIPKSIRLYNISGQLLYYSKKCDRNMNISVSSLSSGIYFLKIETEKSTTTKKVIIQ